MKRARSVSPLPDSILSQVMPLSPHSDAETFVISDPIDLTLDQPHHRQQNLSDIVVAETQIDDDETQTLVMIEPIERDLVELLTNDTQNRDRIRILGHWF